MATPSKYPNTPARPEKMRRTHHVSDARSVTSEDIDRCAHSPSPLLDPVAFEALCENLSEEFEAEANKENIEPKGTIAEAAAAKRLLDAAEAGIMDKAMAKELPPKCVKPSSHEISIRNIMMHNKQMLFEYLDSTDLMSSGLFDQLRLHMMIVKWYMAKNMVLPTYEQMTSLNRTYRAKYLQRTYSSLDEMVVLEKIVKQCYPEFNSRRWER